MSILYSKTSKKFYNHIKFWKSIMNRRCSIKKTLLKNFAIFTGKHLCWSLFLNKNIIKKRLRQKWILDNTAKFLRTASESFSFYVSSNVFLQKQKNIASYIGSEEDVFSKTKQKNTILKLR